VTSRPLALVDALNAMRSRWPNIPAERFVELVEAWAEREGIEAWIVFDGQAPSAPTSARVIGTGPSSADDGIAEEAPRLAAEGRQVWLVSSDRELRGRVAESVEQTIGGGAFEGELLAMRLH
jgi:hypothetical protein